VNIARARGLAESLREHPEHGVRQVGKEIEKALRWDESDEFAATQRTLGAMVAKYGANLSEESEEQAKILAFVALAGIGK
jgi:hypothetical protein